MILVISDVHSNLQALRRLEQWLSEPHEGLEISTCVSLGDQIGYNANPQEVLETLQGWDIKFGWDHSKFLIGNHESLLLDRENPRDWRGSAVSVIENQKSQISWFQKEWISALPYQIRDDPSGVVFTHGTPYGPEEFNYICNSSDAVWVFATGEYDREPFRVCFFGHSHSAGGWSQESHTNVTNRVKDLSVHAFDNEWMPILPGHRYLINPGSLGQPRDGDPRLSFLVYDDSQESPRVKWFHLEYDVQGAVDAAKKLGQDSSRLLKGQ